MLAVAGCSTAGLAQSVIHDFGYNMAQSTVEPVPGTGEYVMSETIFDPMGGSDNYIHFAHYDQSGTILNANYFGAGTHNEQNVDITLNSNTGEYLITTLSEGIFAGWPLPHVGLIKTDVNGTLIAQSLFVSSSPTYWSLYPLDAAFDAGINQYVICGMATNGGTKINDSKVAFVATVDNNLNTTSLNFYDSDPIPGTDDYDMATRIVVLGPFKWYITGSSNVNKGGGHVMGIRNMLIEPTLWPVPTFDIPLQLNNTTSQENGVDMLPITDPSGNTNYMVLVNSTYNNRWRLIRVNPATGLPVSGTKSDGLAGHSGYGFSLHAGNNPDEVVVSGMKYRYNGNCNTTDAHATPFMTTMDFSSPFLISFATTHKEYYTATGSSSYWGKGGFWGTPNAYPVPSFLNNFADREATGSPYSVVTPVHFGSYLTTKYLDVDNQTNNGCDDKSCGFDTEQFQVIDANVPTSMTSAGYTTPTKTLQIQPTSVISSADCSQGWYKGGSTTGISELNPGEAKIYPNPVTTGSITVELGSNYSGKDVLIGLYDVTGKQVALLHNGNMPANSKQLTLPNNIATGMYMLQIQSAGEKTITERITVNK